MSSRVVGLLAFLWVGLASAEVSRLQAATIRLLDFQPYAVSGDGSVVVGQDPSSRQAVRWTWQEGAVPLPFVYPANQKSLAYDVSFDGTVIVGSEWDVTSAVDVAFRWTADDGMVELGWLGDGAPDASGYGSVASSVSADRSVVVGSSGTEGYWWTDQDGMVGLGFLDGHAWSGAEAVSSDGSVIVGMSFRWTAEDGMVELDVLPENLWSWPHGVSADGLVIVGESVHQAFRWTSDEGMVPLDWSDNGTADPRFGETAFAVSADGQVVVGGNWCSWGPGRDFSAPWIWDETHGLRNLENVLADDYGVDLTGFGFAEATDISADGRVIVGTGRFNSEPKGWIAVIPEPSTLALLTMGTAAVTLLTWARRRRKQIGTRSA